MKLRIRYHYFMSSIYNKIFWFGSEMQSKHDWKICELQNAWTYSDESTEPHSVAEAE